MEISKAQNDSHIKTGWACPKATNVWKRNKKNDASRVSLELCLSSWHPVPAINHTYTWQKLFHRSKWTISSWWFQALWKILVKMESSPNRGENKKYLKPPPRYPFVSFSDPTTLWFFRTARWHWLDPVNSSGLTRGFPLASSEGKQRTVLRHARPVVLDNQPGTSFFFFKILTLHCTIKH